MDTKKSVLHLPFVEKYRPRTIENIVSHQDTVKTLKKFIKTKNISHLLFYGPPGTGKTSTIDAFTREIYGENISYMVMNINASEERGIEVVRNKIRSFVCTLPVYKVKKDAYLPAFKMVILDEADAMTSDAQAMLRQVMEKYTYNARFCLICNRISGINDAVQSRCTLFKFPPLPLKCVKKKIKIICSEQNISFNNSGVETLWRLTNGDMRKILHYLQVISINYKFIDRDIVTNFIGYPSASQIARIYKTILKKDILKAAQMLQKIIHTHGLAVRDIITELANTVITKLIKNNLDNDIAKHIITHLRNIEMNVMLTGYSKIQIYSVVCAFIPLAH